MRWWRVEHIGEPAERLRIAAAIERGPLGGPGIEETIEEKEGDAEVLVHQSLVVEGPVMDVMGIARRNEPALEEWISLHPEIRDVHAIVEITEHDEAPRQGSRHEYHLVNDGHAQEVEHGDRQDQKQRTRHEPLHADVSKREGAGGGVVIAGPGTLRLKRAIEHQVVPHVAAAQETNLAAVQKSMQQVTEEFGNQDRSGQPGHNCDCVFHGRTVGRFHRLRKRQASSAALCRKMPGIV